MWKASAGPGAVVLGGEGALGALASDLPADFRGRRVLLVVDRAVADRVRWVAGPLQEAGCAVEIFTVDGGEAVKRWDRIESMLTAAVGHGVRRDGLMVAVGGGAVTDAAGFAAAVYLRGIPWIAVPTTLLGQVDAAVGGKTGIDLEEGKNLAGAFHMPRMTVADPRWISTLPPREWRSGLGEVVKAALLTGDAAWRAAQELAAPPGGQAGLMALAESAVRLKIRVVADDPEEARANGGRAVLNLGHTLGHAVEAAAGMGPLAHGEAVGVGLLAACWVSERVADLDPAVRPALRAVLQRWEMPTGVPHLDPDAVKAYLARDKKSRANRVPWVVLEAPGRARLAPVPADVVDEAVERAVSLLL
jgi:shikimate kinase/3-dehydroquinate synthase